MTPLNIYMQSTRDVRTSHLRLEEPCSLIGGVSSNFTALLAYFLNTTIPNRGDTPKVHLCHACGNGACSNVYHLYWGTPKENAADAKLHGTWKSIFERTHLRYGDSHKEMLKRNASIAGKNGGGHNRLSIEREEEIKSVIASVPEGYGRVAEISRRLGVSHTTVRKYLQRWVGRAADALPS